MQTPDQTFAVSLSAAELNAVIDSLLDVAGTVRAVEAGAAAMPNGFDAKVYDAAALGELADKLEKVLHPDWNPDEV